MKILVGFNGGKLSDKIIKVGITQARAFDAKVFLVQSWKDGRDHTRQDVEDTELELERVSNRLTEEGIDCEKQLFVRGLNPGEDLIRFTRDNGIDEIIIGVKPRSRVGKALFGSTAQYVILHAPCPVVTVK
jgi:nucleotide-binding universal stress UspA family protein